MKSTVSCRGHRWLENDKTAFGGTESHAGALRPGTLRQSGTRWETEERRHIHGAEHPEIQQERAGQAVLDSGARPRGRDGVRMKSSEELFASVAAPR